MSKNIVFSISKPNFIIYNTSHYNNTYIKTSIFLPFHLNNVSLLFFNIFFIFPLSPVSLSSISLSFWRHRWHHPPTHQKPTTHTTTTTNKKRKRKHTAERHLHIHIHIHPQLSQPLTTTNHSKKRKKERKETSTIATTRKPTSRPIMPNQNPKDTNTTSLLVVIFFHGLA